MAQILGLSRNQRSALRRIVESNGIVLLGTVTLHSLRDRGLVTCKATDGIGLRWKPTKAGRETFAAIMARRDAA